MLHITIPGVEFYNEQTNEFINTKEQKLQLEHSLVSLSKWEAKWNKPFLGKDKKTEEETLDYLRCMTLTQNVDYEVYNNITIDLLKQVTEYIEAPNNATVFLDEVGKKTKNRDTITAEIIYYWMIALNVPFECQKWHLNKLLALIKVCNIKNTPPKKMSKRELVSRNRRLNAERREKLQTKG